MRAREPDKAGYVERDGVKVAYESFGDGDTTVVFVPVDTIVDSRAWKGQVPVPVPALPRGRRSTRAATVAPTGRPTRRSSGTSTSSVTRSR